jgi:hypothetical protein
MTAIKKIPNGSERKAVAIPLFDRSKRYTGRAVVYLTAPIPLYGSVRFADAIVQIWKRHPKAQLLLPKYRNSGHWQGTYRQRLCHVTHVYSLAHEDGTIGAGAYAELVHLMRPGSPDKRSYRRASLCFCGAFAADPSDRAVNVLHVCGSFEPMRRARSWWWTQAARLVLPNKPRACLGRSVRARGSMDVQRGEKNKGATTSCV